MTDSGIIPLSEQEMQDQLDELIASEEYIFEIQFEPFEEEEGEQE